MPSNASQCSKIYFDLYKTLLHLALPISPTLGPVCHSPIDPCLILMQALIPEIPNYLQVPEYYLLFPHICTLSLAPSLCSSFLL